MGLASTSDSDENHSLSSVSALVRYCPFTLARTAQHELHASHYVGVACGKKLPGAGRLPSPHLQLDDVARSLRRDAVGACLESSSVEPRGVYLNLLSMLRTLAVVSTFAIAMNLVCGVATTATELLVGS